MPNVTIKAPADVLDQFAGITGLFPLSPNAGVSLDPLPPGITGEMPKPSNGGAPLTPNWNPQAPSTLGTGAPDMSAAALPPIAPASAPGSMAAPAPAEGSSDYWKNKLQSDIDRKQPGLLGKIGGWATSILTPHIAAMIPQTPLGRIAAENRDVTMGQEAQRSEEEARAAQSAEEMKNAQIQAMGSMVPVKVGDQTFYLHEKDAANVIGKQVQGGATVEAAGERAGAAEYGADKRLQSTEMTAGANAGKAQATTLQLPSGEKVAGKKDTKGNLLLADGSPAPKGTVLYQQPNYGQLVLPTKTIQGFDASGQPTVFGWNEKTQKYDIPQAASSAGAAGHQIFQAGAVERSANDLISTIQQNKNKFGNMEAIINSAFLGTPLSDPVSQGLAAQIASFAALNPALHGMKGKDALEEFLKLIGGLPNNPDALIAGIQGIVKGAAKPMRGEDQGGKGGKLPEGAIAGTMNGKHGYVLNGEFHAD